MKMSYRSRSVQLIAATVGICAALVGCPTLAAAADANALAASADKTATTSVSPSSGTTGATGSTTGAASSATSSSSTPAKSAAGTATTSTSTKASTGTAATDSGTTAKSTSTSTKASTSAGTGTAGSDTTSTSETKAAASTTPATASAASSSNKTIDDGTYVIEAGTAYKQVLDVAGGSKQNGTNVQTYESNMSNAQRWNVKYNEGSSGSEGYYTISMGGTSGKKVLDVAAGSSANGTNVQIYDANGSDAQKWLIVAGNKSGYYTLVSLLSPSGRQKVLDVAAGSSSNGANVQLYDGNNTMAQLFAFLSVGAAAPGTNVIADGTYSVGPSAASGYSLDISAGSLDNGGNAQLYSRNGSNAQRYYFKYDGAGYYTIAVTGSNRVLDADGGNIVPTTNVQQYESNGSNAQKWVVIANADGSYTFINKASSLALDITGAMMRNGTNIDLWSSNGTSAQKFKLSSTDSYANGIYSIRDFTDTSKTLDIINGSSASGTAAQIYDYNGTLAQKYQLVKVGSDEYRIRTAASGGWLTASGVKSGSKVVQSGSSKTSESDLNTWQVVWNNGLSFFNKAAQLVLDVAGNGTSNGTKVDVWGKNGSLAQRFGLASENLISNGYYIAQSALGKVLDIAGGSTSGHANVQTYSSNGSNAQKYLIEWTGSGYRIKNVNSGLVLDVADASKADGANVQQWDDNGLGCQRWTASIADGGYVVFINVNSGKALDVLGGNKADGANVDQYRANGTDAQKWHLVATTVWGWAINGGGFVFYGDDGIAHTYNARTYRAWQQIASLSSATRYCLTIDNDNCCVNAFVGRANHWEPVVGRTDMGAGVGCYELGVTSHGIMSVTGFKERVASDGLQWYFTQFNPTSDEYGQGFHTVLDSSSGDPNSTSSSDQTWTHISHGCIRLLPTNAYWIWTTIPTSTMVCSFGNYGA